MFFPTIRAGILSALLFSSLIFRVAAQVPGTVDSTFGINGKTFYAMPVSGSVQCMAVQPDGKILAAGNAYPPGGEVDSILLLRFNADGTPDLTFGNGGYSVTLATIDSQEARTNILDMGLQPDGSVVLCGGESYPFGIATGRYFVARFKPDGTPDSTFNGNGFQSTPVTSSYDRAQTVCLQSDGKIVLAGRATENLLNATTIGMVRYNANGTLDSTFNGNGIFAGTIEYSGDAYDVAQLAGGQLLVSSASRYLRMNANGTPDTSFGYDGVSDIPGTPIDEWYESRLQTDESVFSVGVSQRPSQADNCFVVLKVRPDGTADSTFGVNGKKFITYPNGAAGHALVTTTNVGVVAGGVASVNSVDALAFAQLNPDGSLNTHFGVNGKALVASGQNYWFVAMHEQAPGSIVALGRTLTTNGAFDTLLLTRIFYADTSSSSCSQMFETEYDSSANTFFLYLDPWIQGNAVSYSWTFGDNTPADSSHFPTHAYSVSDVYNVCLRVGFANSDSCTYCHAIGIDSLGNPVTRVDDSGFSLNVLPAATSVPVSSRSNAAMDVSPNPVLSNARVLFSNPVIEADRTARVTVYNALGQPVVKTSVTLHNGRNEFNVPMDRLSAGPYRLSLSSGAWVFFATVVKL